MARRRASVVAANAVDTEVAHAFRTAGAGLSIGLLAIARAIASIARSRACIRGEVVRCTRRDVSTNPVRCCAGRRRASLASAAARAIAANAVDAECVQTFAARGAGLSVDLLARPCSGRTVASIGSRARIRGEVVRATGIDVRASTRRHDVLVAGLARCTRRRRAANAVDTVPGQTVRVHRASDTNIELARACAIARTVDAFIVRVLARNDDAAGSIGSRTLLCRRASLARRCARRVAADVIGAEVRRAIVRNAARLANAFLADTAAVADVGPAANRICIRAIGRNVSARSVRPGSGRNRACAARSGAGLVAAEPVRAEAARAFAGHDAHLALRLLRSALIRCIAIMRRLAIRVAHAGRRTRRTVGAHIRRANLRRAHFACARAIANLGHVERRAIRAHTVHAFRIRIGIVRDVSARSVCARALLAGRTRLAQPRASIVAANAVDAVAIDAFTVAQTRSAVAFLRHARRQQAVIAGRAIRIGRADARARIHLAQIRRA